MLFFRNYGVIAGPTMFQKLSNLVDQGFAEHERVPVIIHGYLCYDNNYKRSGKKREQIQDSLSHPSLEDLLPKTA